MIPYAFFLDIDDTLLYNQRVSQRVLTAMNAARKKGHKVYVNTGRAPSYFTDTIRALPVDGFVCGCGAYAMEEGKTLFRHRYPEDAALRLLERFSHPGDPGIVVEGENRIFRFRNSYWKPEKDWILGNTVEEFRQYLAADRIVKISICQDIDPAVIPQLEQDFWVIHHPTEHYTECCIKGCSKATGMRKIMELCNLPMERSIAIGDSENDLDMIRAAGVGIVMGQARDEIKAAADLVTDPVQQDGAATAIERFL